MMLPRSLVLHTNEEAAAGTERLKSNVSTPEWSSPGTPDEDHNSVVETYNLNLDDWAPLFVGEYTSIRFCGHGGVSYYP